MASSEDCCGGPGSVHCEWCSMFAVEKPCPISQDEPQPHVPEVQENDTEDTPIQLFMRDDGVPRNCSFKAERVQSFLDGSGVINQGTDSEVVLIGDIVDNDTTEIRALTAKEVANSLSDRHSQSKAGNRPVPEGGKEENGPGPPPNSNSLQGERNAHRRWTYVTDLDHQTLLAVINSASVSETWALPDAIFNHLAFKSSINAGVLSDGLNTFRLGFDLPFYALRAHLSSPQDPRLERDRQPLRPCRDVSFLWEQSPSNAYTKPGKQYLCPAHVSFVISGTHNNRWTAHMFLDTYFDEEDEREESIVNYAPVSASEDDGHMLQDPLLAGKAADKPILDPRSYFLEAFTIRIRRVNSEWRMVLQVLGDQIASAIAAFASKMSSWDADHPTAHRTALDLVDKAQKWRMEASQVVTLLTKDLLPIKAQWAVFCTAERNAFFRNMGDGAQRNFQVLEAAFAEHGAFNDDLISMNRSLDGLTEQITNMTQRYSMVLQRMQYDTMQRMEWLADQQYQTAKRTEALVELQYAMAKSSHSLVEQQYDTAKSTNTLVEQQYTTAECTKETTERAKGASMASLLLTSIQATVGIYAIRGPLPANRHLEIAAILSISLVLFLLLSFLVHQKRCVEGFGRFLRWLADRRRELTNSMFQNNPWKSSP